MKSRSIDVPTLSLADARWIALEAQGLGGERAAFGTGKAGALRAVEQLGYVQVDTISVLQRAHHHVVWSRVPDYRPEYLHELQSPDAAVFEYWNHAASYLPTSDYRYSVPLMRKHREELHWSTDSEEIRKAMRRVMSTIRKSGPLRLRDVEPTVLVPHWPSSAPGKIEKRALHELWMRGEVMIRSREGFQKVFDLPERILPADLPRRQPGPRETAEFHVRRALRALGVARQAELHYLRDGQHSSAVRAALKGLVQRGEVQELRVAEFPEDPVFALPGTVGKATGKRERHVRFLSPFDNLIIQRKRMKWLFDFDYTVEIYVPAPKRKYGYFVLPILWGDRIIGRMDAKALRSERQLIIHNLVFEPGFRDFREVAKPFRAALEEFARFQDCDAWTIAKAEPADCGFLGK